MRMLLTMSIPVEARNAAAKAGTLSLASEPYAVVEQVDDAHTRVASG
jgi:hypothetical protein